MQLAEGRQEKAGCAPKHQITHGAMTGQAKKKKGEKPFDIARANVRFLNLSRPRQGEPKWRDHHWNFLEENKALAVDEWLLHNMVLVLSWDRRSQ